MKSHFLSFYWAKTARGHFFCTYPLVIYENGLALTDQALIASGSTYYDNISPLIVFGRRYTDGQQGPYDYATGFVDGVKIYDRSLNATEVLALYNSNENEY